MRERVRVTLGVMVLVLAVAGALAPTARAEDEGWKDVAEFSYVVTGGNSDTSTLGFKNTLTRKWTNALFELRAGAINAKSETGDSIAIGAPGSFFVRDPEKETFPGDDEANTYLDRPKRAPYQLPDPV